MVGIFFVGSTIFELQQSIYYRVQKEYGEGAITVDELKTNLEEVLELLKYTQQIFNFDDPSSRTGRMGQAIPENIAVIKTVLRKVCEVE